MTQDAGPDGPISLVGAGEGVALQCRSAMRHAGDGIVFRQVHGDNGPAVLECFTLWRKREANLARDAFLALLREA